MTKALIIATHGLANKPPEDVLTGWWRDSIHEGLAKNECLANPTFDFEMIYWRDLLYKTPLHDDENFHFDSHYNDEPYRTAEEGALKRYKDGIWDDFAAASAGLLGESLDFLKERFGVGALADAVLGKLLKDLSLYYEDAGIRAALRARLTEKLLAAQGRKIMLVAHSMGSIIAYDVLTLLGQSHPDFEVDHFVTIGSPLGLPHVKGKIIEEFAHRGAKSERIRTPTAVKGQWVNFADRKDPVALDVHLRGDFKKHKETNVECRDDLVENDYAVLKRGEKEPARNHHKSYGYLRTPEFSELVKGFI